ncbi:MAG: hypothetical protein K2G36_10830 [Ruminococcus sp.]|nr:hypothetical protein [Ruminococcus sp.]
MQLTIHRITVNKNNNYSVEDKKARTLYTIKKKGFGNNNKLYLLNSSNYHLYTLIGSGVDSLSYKILTYTYKMENAESKKKEKFTEKIAEKFSEKFSENSFMDINCKSKFVEPMIECKGNGISYRLISGNKRDFKIMVGEEEKGTIETNVSTSGKLQYELEIDDQFFDDYIPLFAVVIDKLYGEINSNPQIINEIAKEKRNKNS